MAPRFGRFRFSLALCFFVLVYFYAKNYLPYSPVFSEQDETYWTRRAIAKNEKRLASARNYFSRISDKESREFYASRLTESLELVFVVITFSRKHRNTEYLTQVVARLDQQLKRERRLKCALVVCDVNALDVNIREVDFVGRYVPVLQAGRKTRTNVDLRNEEKEDYIECVRNIYEKADFQFLVVLEDDALPKEDFLDTLYYILRRKVELQVRRSELVPGRNDWALIKLYYPEKWEGYGLDWRSLTDLLSLSALLAFSVANRSDFRGAALILCYFCAIQLLVGRQYFSAFRDLHPVFSRMVEAPGCCTPAVLYPRQVVPSLVSHMKLVRCSALYPYDVALDDFVDSKHLKRYLVEPNLVQHIGMYSTLTSPKAPWFY